MSLLTRDRRDAPSADSTRTSGPAQVRSPLLLGALGGGQAALGSLICIVVPVVLVWMASTTTAAVWTEAVRTGAAAWLLGHRVTVHVDGGFLSLVPLGLTAVPALWCWESGRRLGEALHALRAPKSSRRDVLRAWAAFTVVYAALAVAAAVVTGSPVVRTSSGQAAAGGAVLAAVVTGAAVLRQFGAKALLPKPAVAPSIQRVLRATAVAVAAWLACGAALGVVALVLGWERVVALREALAPDVLGGAGVLIAELGYLPTLVVWAAAWVAGPGFAVGTGTSVTPAVVTLGPLPAFPALGALPEPTMLPGVWWAVIGLPVLAGGLAGWYLRRSARHGSLVTDLAQALGVGSVSGAVAAALAWLAHGSIGPGRMAELGPSPAWVGLCLAGEIAAGAVIAVLLLPRANAAQADWRAGLQGHAAKLRNWVSSSSRRS